MPEYEYVCDKGHEFQVTQRITEEPLETCTVIKAGGPGCPSLAGSCDFGSPRKLCGAPCKRIISKGGSFVLRGGGWAAHGYGNK